MDYSLSIKIEHIVDQTIFVVGSNACAFWKPRNSILNCVIGIFADYGDLIPCLYKKRYIVGEPRIRGVAFVDNAGIFHLIAGGHLEIYVIVPEKSSEKRM
jgi:hypothetical protein